MSQLSFSDEFLVLAFFWLAHKLHYIQYKADISRWACSNTGKWKNMHFRLWGELVTRCLWELWSLFKVYVLKGSTSHLCKLHMGPRMASNLVEMYVKTELWRTTLHTHTSLQSDQGINGNMHDIFTFFFCYCTWKAMELARARKTRRGNEAL